MAERRWYEARRGRAGAAAGDSALVRLIEVDDDHSLHASVEDGSIVAWVRALAAPR